MAMIPVLLAAAAVAPLSPASARALDCAAAFAVGAVLQARDDPAVRALPPLDRRGRAYFATVATRIAGETGLNADALRTLLAAAARRLGPAGAPAMATTCLADLDAIVPPAPPPDAATCHALLAAYAAELARRDPADPLAARLAGEAASLARNAAADALAAAQHAQQEHPGDADTYRACRRIAAHANG